MNNKPKQMGAPLGFGLMRLPKKGRKTDQAQLQKMVDAFMAAGNTYFDTAYVYGSSERDIKEALVDRYPRESFTLATKLNPMLAFSEKKAKEQFYKSLERTGAGYFDYYLLHALMDRTYNRYEKFHLWQFIAELKEKGLIRHIGFSFHGSPQVLDKLLNEHPEVDFVQLQLNYADWNHPKIQSRANYEVARKHGVPIVIMEPVKGGKLAAPGSQIEKMMKDYNPKASAASWALRFAAGLDGILAVLSGMSSLEQMQDNLQTFSQFEKLNNQEQKILEKAQKILGQSNLIECTACKYCTKGCPRQIPIPKIFEALNLELSHGQLDKARELYEKAVNEAGLASDCIECGQCERACPQHIEIIENLKKARKLLETKQA